LNLYLKGAILIGLMNIIFGFQGTAVITAILALIVLFLISHYNRFHKLMENTKQKATELSIIIHTRAVRMRELLILLRMFSKKHDKEQLDAIGHTMAILDDRYLNMQELLSADAVLDRDLVILFECVAGSQKVQQHPLYRELRDELNSIEARHAAAVTSYSTAILTYHTVIGSFPNMLAARTLGFKRNS
jgi:LemA protein